VLQSAKPLLQLKPHIPRVQVRVALGGVGHTLLHLPQWAVSVWVLTSQPSTGFMLQSAKPAVQVKPHVPRVQVRVALGGVGHTLLQRPQWEGLLLRSVSQPLARLPSQSPKPALHTV